MFPTNNELPIDNVYKYTSVFHIFFLWIHSFFFKPTSDLEQILSKAFIVWITPVKMLVIFKSFLEEGSWAKVASLLKYTSQVLQWFFLVPFSPKVFGFEWGPAVC